MRLFFLLLVLSLAGVAPLRAQNEPVGSALGAIKLLPRGEAKKLARIEARDGTPVPERWHFIVHDPKSPTGVREYVIAAGEIVASRELSQFVENLNADDVFGGEAVKINSDRIARLAVQYAHANNQNIATMHYELKKQGAAAVALWTVICMDEAGQELGRLLVSAGKGNVVAHPGFPIEPPPPVVPVATPTLTEKMRQPAEVAVPRATPMPVVVAEAVEPVVATPPPKKPGLFDRIFKVKERKPPE